MATVTKKELVDRVAAKMGFNQQDVRKITEAFIQNIKSDIAAENRIELRGFGVFSVKVRKSRIGRNPKKPENVVTIPERRIVHFKVGREFKKLIKQ